MNIVYELKRLGKKMNPLMDQGSTTDLFDIISI